MPPTITKYVPPPPANGVAYTRDEAIEILNGEIDVLLDRLDRGAVIIENMRRAGQDVTAKEDYWIILLRQYEKLCDERRSLGYYQAEGVE